MGFEPRMPGRKANTITTELKRILPNAVVRYCILNRETAMLKGVVSCKKIESICISNERSWNVQAKGTFKS